MPWPVVICRAREILNPRQEENYVGCDCWNSSRVVVAWISGISCEFGFHSYSVDFGRDFVGYAPGARPRCHSLIWPPD